MNAFCVVHHEPLEFWGFFDYILDVLEKFFLFHRVFMIPEVFVYLSLPCCVSDKKTTF